jgi:hypothetical protein
VVRSLYEHTDPDLAVAFVERLGHDLQDESCPIEVRSLGRTLLRWSDPIAAGHHAHVSNGPTGAANNPIKASSEWRWASPDGGTTGSESCPTPAGPLGPTRHHYTPLKSEESLMRAHQLTSCVRSAGAERPGGEHG